MSDFLVQRILGLKAPLPTPVPISEGATEEQSVVVPKMPMSLADYATALQLMQLQMFCQPSLLSSFLNQMTVMGFATNNDSHKVCLTVSCDN